MINQSILNIHEKKISVNFSGAGNHTIIFIHGSSMCSNTWSQQLSNLELQKRYQLVAIDLPGHGKSQWLDNVNEYTFENMVGVIQRIVIEFSVTSFILAGMSYGTNIIGEIVPPIQGCKGIMLISPCIINDSLPPSEVIIASPYAHLIVAENPPEDELKDYIRWGIVNKDVGSRYYDTYRNTDPAFRQSLARSILNNESTDELKNIQQWNVPVCAVFGEDEKLLKTDYLDSYPPLWKGKTYKIKNAGHMIQEENPDDFNELLLSFATATFK